MIALHARVELNFVSLKLFALGVKTDSVVVTVNKLKIANEIV